MAGLRKVRIICTDPDATDYSSSSNSDEDERQCRKRVVRECLLPAHYALSANEEKPKKRKVCFSSSSSWSKRRRGKRVVSRSSSSLITPAQYPSVNTSSLDCLTFPADLFDACAWDWEVPSQKCLSPSSVLEPTTCDSPAISGDSVFEFPVLSGLYEEQPAADSAPFSSIGLDDDLFPPFFTEEENEAPFFMDDLLLLDSNGGFDFDNLPEACECAS